MHDIQIRRLEASACHDWSKLLQESRREGYRHIDRLTEAYRNGTNRFDREGELLLAAEIGGELAGIGGLNGTPLPAVGRVRRVYVSPEFRRRGVARTLMQALIASAGPAYGRLVLRTDNPAACALYESLGFRSVQGEEGITHELNLMKDIGG
ncbi:GNAT family N-acetyltransferase [Paenibacillus sp. R14(2021)]|uniref:GNAT family N-acetyltransferase n=1 Tax=Paenibacillus sp. R14(2021) TaxID=2859228 RepID=UPI001C6117D4|nr:GNAT family N-acetyltransferase [Paenibacillus sp. R14(2021)]